MDFSGKPTYQRVLGNRPLVHLFYVDGSLAKYGTIHKAREDISHLRKQTEAAA